VTAEGERAVSGSGDMTIQLWDLSGGGQLARLDLDAPCTALAVAPDGHTIVAGDSLGRIHFLQIED
jgi:WD40 repeat protein